MLMISNLYVVYAHYVLMSQPMPSPFIPATCAASPIRVEGGHRYSMSLLKCEGIH